jgi:hypothetical protein
MRFTYLVLTSLLLHSCVKPAEEFNKCQNGAKHVGKLRLNDFETLYTIFNKDSLKFHYNDSATINLIRTDSVFESDAIFGYDDSICGINYWPEYCVVTYRTGLGGYYENLFCQIRADYPTGLELRLTFATLSGYSGQNDFFKIKLTQPKIPIQFPSIIINNILYQNVGVINSDKNGKIFFTEKNEIIEIRTTDGQKFTNLL